MEGELIFLGFIMLIGQIILLQMWNMNWFKRENFKINKKSLEGEMRIRHRKLERDLGLKPSKAPKEEKSTVDSLKDWYSILKNIEPDKIKELADTFLSPEGEEYEEDEDEDVIGTILKNIPKESIEEFFKGLGKGTQEQIKSRTDNY